MISFIKGILFSHEEENAIIDVGGIGYHLFIPPNIFPQDKKPGDEVFFYTYLQIKEDSWQLFGFPLKEQLEVFRLLISVSWIGAKLGMSMLNHFSYRQIISLITSGDSKGLSTVPGIGKKTAQRLVLELKEKFKKMDESAWEKEDEQVVEHKSLNEDAVLALIQLGYSAPEARSACLRAYNALGPEAETQEIIKGALKLLGKF